MKLEKAIEIPGESKKGGKMRKYLITNHTTKERIIVEANSAQEAAQQVGCHIKEVSPIDIGQPKLLGMPISKAIEILELNIKEAGKKMPPDCRDAVQIGIEAMKHIEAYRHPPFQGSKELLPGETPEN